MSSPPTLDAGPVHDEDGLSDGQGAVIPDNQEHDQQIKDTEVEEIVCARQYAADQVHYQFELLVLLLVLILLVPVQDVAVHVAKDCPKVSA